MKVQINLDTCDSKDMEFLEMLSAVLQGHATDEPVEQKVEDEPQQVEEPKTEKPKRSRKKKEEPKEEVAETSPADDLPFSEEVENVPEEPVEVEPEPVAEEPAAGKMTLEDWQALLAKKRDELGLANGGSNEAHRQQFNNYVKIIVAQFAEENGMKGISKPKELSPELLHKFAVNEFAYITFDGNAFAIEAPY